MKVARTISAVRDELREGVGTIGLVPTMGALHAGHLSLLAAARAECDTVVMSLFVNPAQFSAPVDLGRYPREEARDLALAEEAGVDVVFAPSAEEMYPPGFQTWVEVTELGSILEGRFRAGHFRGVATIVLKLFSIVRPDVAYFGQKDAQQVEVIRRLIRDLALEVELRSSPRFATTTDLRCPRGTRSCRRSSARRRWLSPAPSEPATRRRREPSSPSRTASSSTTSSSSRSSTRPSSPARSASAPRA